MLYSFKINGIEVGDPSENGSGYVLFNTYIENTRDNTKTDSAILYLFQDVSTVINLTEGQEVIITRGQTIATETTVFKGNIKEITFDDTQYIVACKEELNKNKYRLFTKSYDRNIDPEAGELSAIFTDIAEAAGYAVDAQLSGTGAGSITADKFISYNESRASKLNLIAQLLNWYYYYDYDNNKIVLQPKGFISYTTSLIVGTNIYNVPRWNTNIEVMRNKITVEGAFEEDTRVDSYIATASQTEFDFTYTPITTDLRIDGTLKTRGVLGATTAYDYTVDTDLKTWTMASALSGGESVVMTYSIKIPKPVTISAPDSIALYGLTQEERYKFDDIQTVDDAETRATQILNALKNGEITTTIQVALFDIQPGMIVEVEDQFKPDKNGEYIVESVKMYYGQNTDEIVIGNQILNISSIFQTIQERINLLETPDQILDEILRQIFSFTRQYQIIRRDFRLEKSEIPTDGFIIGHPEYSILGTSQLGEGSGFVDSDLSLQQGQNDYRELVRDTDYYDSINSTGITWDTVNNKITFAADGVLYTNPIAFGQTYSSFQFTPGGVTGSLKFEVSFDNGSNYQEITTFGTLTNITNNGTTGVILKITELASAAAEINTSTYVLRLKLNQ